MSEARVPDQRGGGFPGPGEPVPADGPAERWRLAVPPHQAKQV